MNKMRQIEAHSFAKEYLSNPANYINGEPIDLAIETACRLVIKNCAQTGSTSAAHTIKE